MPFRFGDFAEATNKAANREEIFDLLKNATAKFGFDHIAVGALTLHSYHQIADAEPHPDTPAPAVVLTYPPEWIRRYFEQSYQEIDPVVLFTPRTMDPFVWSDLCAGQNLTPQQRQMFGEATEFGVKEGLSIPVHGPSGTTYVVSLAKSISEATPQDDVFRLRAVAVQFLAAYYGQDRQPFKNASVLTERERDCLLWSARGKSNWDIGKILNISEHTVDFHFRRALSKLSCNNRVVAVVKAVRMGIISP